MCLLVVLLLVIYVGYNLVGIAGFCGCGCVRVVCAWCVVISWIFGLLTDLGFVYVSYLLGCLYATLVIWLFKLCFGL